MDRRLLLAVVLSILVMLLYPVFLSKLIPPQQKPDFISQPIEKQKVIQTTPGERGFDLDKSALPPDAKSIMFVNDRYMINLCDVGGSIQDIEIKDKNGLDMDLVNNAIYRSGILAVEGQGSLAGAGSQRFEISSEGPIYAQVKSFKIEKSVSFLKDKYGLSASIKIENLSNSLEPLQFELTTASNISGKELYESRYIEAVALYTNGRLKKIAGGNFKKTNRLYQNDIEWLALKNKYHSIIAKPDFQPAGIFTANIESSPVIGFIVDETIMPGQTKEYNLLFYIGPTEIKELESVELNFGAALNFGIFTSICLILLSILKFFYSLFHNYGVSILLLTGCISLALFPLTFKSFKSMRKLQELQPHIEKVRAAHKDNPHKLNKEIMELYRRYNVNPMGGCFPMFLQMPIFISLYQMLMRSVELKGAAFLWIKDLSMPDALFQLPFALPVLGDSINLLPILMIGAMILQQKMSQAKTAALQTEQQKMMSAIMPLLFGFIFYSLPAGLVLYWLTNTLLTAGLQFLLLRRA